MNVITGNWVGVKSLLAVLAIGAEAAFADLHSSGSSESRSGYVQGEVLVKLKDGSHSLARTDSMTGRMYSDALGRLQAKYGLQEGTDVQDSNRAYWRDGFKVQRFSLLKTDRPVPALCAELRKDPDVAMAQPNYIYRPCRQPNDPDFPDQYAHQLIQMPDAWDIATGSREVVVAVLGTGVDIDHNDLKDNIWVNSDEIPDNGLDDDLNGYVDDVHGWNFGGHNNQVNPRLDASAYYAEHETQVAGVIAAQGNNGQGVCGVNWQCSIMVLRFSDDYTSVEVAAGLDYAAANGAHIANMSFGSDDFGPDGDPIVQEAIDHAFAAGVLLVASAGNDDSGQINYPAGYYNVMAVASTNGEDLKTGHSSFGPWVDLAAPGTDIVTTDLGGGYVSTAGTSFSSPYVAAVAALVLSQRPDLTHMELRAILENTADPVFYGDLDPNTCYLGTGRVNAYRALLAADVRYPLAEVVAPSQGQSLARDAASIQVTLLVHGDGYQAQLKAHGLDAWTTIAEGGSPAEPNGLVHLSLANPGTGVYDVRLHVTRNGATCTDLKSFAVDLGSAQTHWPLPEKVDWPPEYVFFGGPLCVDADADGRNEVLQSLLSVSTYDSLVTIWDEDSNSQAGWPAEMGIGDWSPAVGDLDGDGDLEVVGADTYGYVFARHAETGLPLDGTWPVSVGGWYGYIASSPVLADLDGDGDSEIVVAVDQESSTTDGLFAIRADGSFLWQRRYTSWGSISAADVDRDGDVELGLCGYGPGITNVYTFLLDHQGQQIRRWKGGSRKGTLFTDLDGDGKMELIFCTDTQVQAVRADGTTAWATRMDSPFGESGALSAGDLDGDGRPDICVVSLVEADGFSYGRVDVLDAAGRMLPGFPRTIMGDPTYCSPLIADIDGDGRREVVVSAGRSPVMAWEADGSACMGFPLFGLVPEWGCGPAIQDLDRDGDAEIMVGGEDYRFHIVDLPGRYDNDPMEWAMGRHDPQCSGWACPAATLDTVNVPDQIKPGQKLQVQLQATNPGNLAVRFVAGNLPEGGYFDPNTRTVFWKPTADQAFHTYTLSFLVTDGIRQAMQTARVSVVPDAIYYADMDTDPNWHLDAGWAWGMPGGKGSWNGDPSAGRTGQNVIGYRLDGDYEDNLGQVRYATTSPIPCEGVHDVRLSFWRWLGVESPYDRACVQVSSDGQTWVDLWTTGYAHISDSAWQYVEYPVPASVTDGRTTLYFRWGMGPTDDSVAYPGWNIDDVLIMGERTQ